MEIIVQVILIGLFLLSLGVILLVWRRRQENSLVGNWRQEFEQEIAQMNRMTELSDTQHMQIQQEVDQNRKINAIKLYREFTGVGLKEAKVVIDAWEQVATEEVLSPVNDVGELEAKVWAELLARRKVTAVKLYRDAMNCSLREAKDYVDALEREILHS